MEHWGIRTLIFASTASGAWNDTRRSDCMGYARCHGIMRSQLLFGEIKRAKHFGLGNLIEVATSTFVLTLDPCHELIDR